jgi:predicted site-specific integrase-resolvase
MHYHNGQAAAKRIGISYKTLLRWIEKGKIRPEEAKTPTGQLVISGDQVEAARKEVLKERSLFIEDEIAIDTSGQP